MAKELPITRETRWCEICKMWSVYLIYRRYVMCGNCSGIEPKAVDLTDPVGSGTAG